MIKVFYNQYIIIFGIDNAIGRDIILLLFNGYKMKKIIAATLALTLTAVVDATPITLDFDSGIATSSQYTEDGFTLAANLPGNHIDDNWLGGSMGFHNGHANNYSNNDLILSYGGAAFDLIDIDITGFYQNGELELTGSDGSTFSSYETGVKTVNFLNVTQVTFSITDYFDGVYGGVAWNSITVDNAPSANSIPEPTSVALLGLAIAGIGISRKKKVN